MDWQLTHGFLMGNPISHIQVEIIRSEHCEAESSMASGVTKGSRSLQCGDTV
jgi:hypothetical protein